MIYIVFTFQSPHNLWLLDLLNYAAKCSNVSSRIWRNLQWDIEININWRSAEFLKLVGRQKIFIFRGGGWAVILV